MRILEKDPCRSQLYVTIATSDTSEGSNKNYVENKLGENKLSLRYIKEYKLTNQGLNRLKKLNGEASSPQKKLYSLHSENKKIKLENSLYDELLKNDLHPTSLKRKSSA